MQGVGTRIPSGKNTIFFISKEKVPTGRTVNYGRITDKIGPQKAETHCTQLTVGWNLINFPGDVTKPISDIIMEKITFNGVLSTKYAKFMCANIANFYLNNSIYIYEYIYTLPQADKIVND